MQQPSKAECLSKRKGRGAITALTAYDYPSARLSNECDIDLLLVGDSLGMVVLGFADTTHVTLDHMLHHTAAVARAEPLALLVADLPIHSYDTPIQAQQSAMALCGVGAEAVKLEGGRDQCATIKMLREAGIEVIGHIGMLPQQVVTEGGYRKKGKNAAAAQALIEDALALESAGVRAIVLESIVPSVATQITQALRIPTIGIGCGEDTCDGEIAVITDVIGSFPWFVPPFARPQAQVAEVITAAIASYCRRVRGHNPLR